MVSYKTLAGVIDAAEVNLSVINPVPNALPAVPGINVESYGAKHDGITDDSAAIQRASNAASAMHKALYFPAGTYDVSKSISINSGSAWIGCTGAVLQATATAPIATIVGANNVAITDLSFVGTAHSTAPLLLGYKSAGLAITGDGFSQTPGIGVLMSDVNTTNVSRSNFFDIGNSTGPTSLLNSAQGLAYCNDNGSFGYGNLVAGNTFSAIGLDAISATGQTNMTASGNVMGQLNTQQGWNVQPRAAAGIYENNDVGGTISGNVISGASGSAIDIMAGSGLGISGNVITGSGAAGISLSSTTNTQVAGNDVSYSDAMAHFVQDAGITVLDILGNGHSSGISIAGNTVTGNGQAGQYAFQEVNVPQGAVTLENNHSQGAFTSILQGFQHGTAY